MIYIPLPSQSGIFFYSNRHYSLQQVVYRFLEKAERSIWIECFMVTDPLILKILKKNEGHVDMHIYHHRQHPSVFSSLDKAEILSSTRSGLMHKKLILIDDEYVLLGSTNLTETSLLMHENIMIGFHCPEMGNAIRHRKPTYQNASFHFYQLPIGKKAFIEDLIPILENAKESIYVVMFCLSHEKIIKSLHEAHQRGVDVQIIIDSHTFDAGLDRYFPIHRIKEKHLMHHKFALIDQKTLVFGSANWTKGGLSKNEEIEVIFHQIPPSMTKSFFSLFKTLRKKSQTTIDRDNIRKPL